MYTPKMSLSHGRSNIRTRFSVLIDFENFSLNSFVNLAKNNLELLHYFFLSFQFLSNLHVDDDNVFKRLWVFRFKSIYYMLTISTNASFRSP